LSDLRQALWVLGQLMVAAILRFGFEETAEET
jgi:hypothetical protein